MSGARALFEQYLNGQVTYLESLRGNEIETALQDFKLFSSRNPANWNNEDKNNLSGALSGFANSEGGVIVWGVNCRRGTDGCDVVESLEPIEQLRAVLSQMQTLTASLVAPAIIGVQHEPIWQDEKAQTGYIVSFVPKGESSPHMAMRGNKYMYRSGDSFLPMPEWMVADRYGRRPQPKLTLQYRSKGAQYVGVQIFNEGLGTARFPGYQLHPTPTFRLANIAADPMNGKMVLEKWSDKCSGQATSDLVIHPMRHLEIASIDRYEMPEGVDEMVVDYELFCDGFYGTGQLKIRRAYLDAIRSET